MILAGLVLLLAPIQAEKEPRPELRPQAMVTLVPESVLGTMEEELQGLYIKLRPYVVQVRMPLAVERSGGVEVQEVLVSGLVLERGGLVVAPGLAGPGAEKIQVRRQDGREFTARSLARDQALGLTLLAVPDLGIPPPPLVVCDTLRVGSLTLAVGNGYGLEGSFSLGFVSGKDRQLGEASGLLQITNPVNPGDGGGLLANRHGQVVGVLLTSLRAAARRERDRNGAPDYEGMLGASAVAFAVPVERVVAAFPRWLGQRLPDRPRLGVVVEMVLDEELRRKSGLADRSGLLLVREVLPGSPAARAGLQPGDLLLDLGGQPLQSLACLRHALATNSGQVPIHIQRGREREALEVDLERPARARAGGENDR